MILIFLNLGVSVFCFAPPAQISKKSGDSAMAVIREAPLSSLKWPFEDRNQTE